MVENLDVFFSDFSVPVVAGVSTFKGILDIPDEVIAGGIVSSTDYAVMCKTSDVAALDSGDAITVDSIPYEVRRNLKVFDGKISVLVLSKI